MGGREQLSAAETKLKQTAQAAAAAAMLVERLSSLGRNVRENRFKLNELLADFYRTSGPFFFSSPFCPYREYLCVIETAVLTTFTLRGVLNIRSFSKLI